MEINMNVFSRHLFLPNFGQSPPLTFTRFDLHIHFRIPMRKSRRLDIPTAFALVCNDFTINNDILIEENYI